MQKAETFLLDSLNDSAVAALTPGNLGMYATRDSNQPWRLFRHMALFNRVALAIAGAIIAGAGFNLLVCIQPQIGKSDFWSKYFPAWIAGTFPDKCISLSSYEATFAEDKGRAVRDLVEQIGPEVFGITVRPDKRAADNWEIFDVREGLPRRGGMITSGVDGPLTGRPVDIGIIDDPIKNHEEAMSPGRLKKINDWYHSVFSTRFKAGGVKIVVMTRWSHEDLIAHIEKIEQESGEKWVKIVLPAIAQADEDWPDWGWHRKKGDVVCPELYSRETMEKRQKATLPFWFDTMYLQRPYPREGGQFKSAWFQIVDQVPALEMETRSWDVAASEDKSRAQTAGVRMGFRQAGPEREDRQYFITDIIADWWGPGTRDKEIKRVAETDGKAVHVLVEQEPGSGGKVQAEAIVAKLDGWATDIVIAGNEGSKLLRADPLGSAAFAGKIYLKRAPWNSVLLEQIRRFPGGKPIDMVDAASQAYNWLADQQGIVEVPDAAPVAGSQVFPGLPPGGLFTGRVF